MNEKIISDKELEEITRYIDAACTLMGASFKLLLNADNKEIVVGFIIGPKEMFSGELEVEEEEGTWTPAEKPLDPKQLN